MALLDTLLGTAVGIGTRAIHDIARRHYDRSGRQASKAKDQVQGEMASRVSQELERRQIPEVEEELGQRVRAELERRGLLNQGAPPIPEPEPKPIDLPPAPFASAVVNAFNYNPTTGDLFVKFQDTYPGTNGPVYVYKGVDPFVYDILKRGAVAPKTSGQNAWHAWKKGIAPSLGASVDALLKKGGYPYMRLT